MYFRNFEKGYYDLKGDGQQKLVTDLMTRVKVREKVIDEISLYDTYDVPNGERPEDIAMKHFGSPLLHWVILISNGVTDAYYQWPLTLRAFEDYIKEKYDNPEGIHHYEKVQSSGPQTSIDNSHLSPSVTTEFSAFAGVPVKITSPGSNFIIDSTN